MAASLAGLSMLIAPAASGGVMESGESVAAETMPVRRAWLWSGYAELLHFGGLVGTIIVGDGAVLDAAVVDGTSVALTGMAPGRTNVIVLGQTGQVLARLDVSVRTRVAPSVSVYRGTERSQIVCDPKCGPGDQAPAVNK